MTKKEDKKVLDLKAARRLAELEKMTLFDTSNLTDAELGEFIKEMTVEFMVEELIPVVNEQGRRILNLEETLIMMGEELDKQAKNGRKRSL